MRLRIVRLQPDRGVIAGQRFIVAPEFEQRVASVAVQLGIARLQRESLGIAGQRFVVASQFAQQIAPVAERVHMVWP